MPDETLAVLGVVVAILVGAMSPGPSFVVTARIALRSRSDALAVAAGLGAGSAVFAVGALAGMSALLVAAPSAFTWLKFVGGLYLLFLAVRLWRSKPLVAARRHIARSPEGCAFGRYLRLGLITQLSNPKTAVVYTSVFAVLLPTGTTWELGLVLTALIVVTETGWYSVVALLLSSKAPQQTYVRFQKVLDRVASAVLGSLAVRMMLDA